MAEQADTTWSAPLAGFRGPRPRVVVKADLLPAVSVASLVGLLGIPLGWLWAQLAPGQRLRVISDHGEAVSLQLESRHRFDGLAIFLLLALAAGILVGIVVWLLRARRGPVVLLAAVAGSALAGWLAMRTGLTFADGLHPVPDRPDLGTVIERAPVLESAWAIVAAPMTTALTYGVLAVWNSSDDLGRRLG